LQIANQKLEIPRSRGVAVVMVLIILAALALLGVPFAVSMNLHKAEASARLARVRARLIAEGALNHAIAKLYWTIESAERAEETRLIAAGQTQPFPLFATPEVDTRAEIQWDRAALRAALYALDPPRDPKKYGDVAPPDRDPHGEIWHASIEDEQGKINADSAPPNLLGCLMGAVTLTDNMTNADAPLVISVEMDPATGRPMMLPDRGLLNIGGEQVAFEVDPEKGFVTVTARDLENRFRPNLPAHRTGTLAYDGRAYEISWQRFKDPGRLLSFRTVYNLKWSQTFQVVSGGKFQDVLFSFYGDEFDRIRSDVTVDSDRTLASGWSSRQLANIRTLKAIDTSIPVSSTADLGRGTAVRVTSGNQVRYNRVRGVNRNRGVTLDATVGMDVSDADIFIESEERHPININTASQETLAAVFTGVSLDGRNVVTRTEAERLAALFSNSKAVYEFGNQLTDLAGLQNIFSSATGVQGADHFRRILQAAARVKLASSGQRYFFTAGDFGRKIDALYINATKPNSDELVNSTTTFVYKSLGTFTIEATGMVMSPAGTTLAKHTLREIVSLPADRFGSAEILSQKQFRDVVKRNKSVGVIDNRNLPSDPPDGSLKNGVGGVMPITLQTMPYQQGRNLPGLIEHFDGRSQNLSVDVEGADLRQGGVYKVTPPPFQPQGITTAPGAVDMWIRPEKWDKSKYTLFDFGEDDARNRVALWYDGARQALVLRVADDTFEGMVKPADYTYPFQFQNKDWYHVQAQWKGNRYGEQAVIVDGFPLPRGNDVTGFNRVARLESPLSGTATPQDAIDLSDASFLPELGGGVVVVGSEIIEYGARKKNTLSNLNRAARFSYLSAHVKDEVVQEYGYANQIQGTLQRGGAVLVGDLSLNPWAQVNKAPTKTDPVGGIKAADTAIPVVDASSLPKSGFMRIRSETIFFGARSDTLLTMVERGMFGSTAADHPHNTGLGLVSMQVSSANDYPDSGWVQVDDEWFWHGRKISWKGGAYFASNDTAQPVGPGGLSGLQRGSYGTPRQAHVDKAHVIPVIQIRDPFCGDFGRLPQGCLAIQDRVTVVNNADNAACDLSVRQARMNAYLTWYPPAVPGGQGRWAPPWHFDFYVGLSDWVDKPVQGRLLKFPSGEPPARPGATLAVGADRRGDNPLRAWVDEIRATPGRGPGLAVARDSAVKIKDTALTLEVLPGAAIIGQVPPQGVAMVDDELVYFESSSVGNVAVRWGPQKAEANKPETRNVPSVTLNNCKRGIFNTVTRAHAEGAPVMLWDAYAVSEISGALTQGMDAVSLRDATGFPWGVEGGYFRMGGQNGEVVGYTQRNGNTLQGLQFLRGRFGTIEVDHSANDLAVWQPARYHDRYNPRAPDDKNWRWFAASFSVPGAYWTEFETAWFWPDANVGGDSFLQAVIHARFDGWPEWWSQPNAKDPRRGDLFSLGDGGLKRWFDPKSPMVHADSVEMRFYWTWKRGAFGPDNPSWKRTIVLDTLRVYYRSLMTVRKHDLVED
jgi:hypothetical protein